jgi:hypothetical protein
MIIKRCFDQVRPACEMRVARALRLLVPLLHFLKCLFDLIAPGLAAGYARRTRRLHTGHAFTALLHALFAREARVDEDPKQTADRDGHQECECEGLHG